MPARRARRPSGIVWFQIVERPSPLGMSPAPANARHSSTSHTLSSRTAAATARPHPAAPKTTNRPCRRTRDVQPLVRLSSTGPAEPAAYSPYALAGVGGAYAVACPA